MCCRIDMLETIKMRSRLSREFGHKGRFVKVLAVTAAGNVYTPLQSTEFELLDGVFASGRSNIALTRAEKQCGEIAQGIHVFDVDLNRMSITSHDTMRISENGVQECIECLEWGVWGTLSHKCLFTVGVIGHMEDLVVGSEFNMAVFTKIEIHREDFLNGLKEITKFMDDKFDPESITNKYFPEKDTPEETEEEYIEEVESKELVLV